MRSYLRLFAPPRAATLAAGTALLLAGCAALEGPPDRELVPLWSEYTALPPQRALAIAGELRVDRWVAGASGGHATRREAEEAAIAECRRRRTLRRLQDPCRLYAVGDEVVWSGP